MAKKLGIVGVFEYLDDLLGAIEALKAGGIKVDTVFSPVPRHEIREALGLSVLSRVKYFTLTGGIIGIFTGIFLVWYTSVQWNFIVGGKPVIPTYPAVIPAFEFLILIAVFFNLGGMLFMNRLPKLRLPPEYDARFSRDRFGILVWRTEADSAQVSDILRQSGAEEVHEHEK
jgi:hypothetical protein